MSKIPSEVTSVHSRPLFRSLYSLHLGRYADAPPRQAPQQNTCFMEILELPGSLKRLSASLVIFSNRITISLLTFGHMHRLNTRNTVNVVKNLQSTHINSTHILTQKYLTNRRYTLIHVRIEVNSNINLIMITKKSNNRVTIHGTLHTRRNKERRTVRSARRRRRTNRNAGSSRSFLLLLVRNNKNHTEYNCQYHSKDSKDHKLHKLNRGNKRHRANGGVKRALSHLVCELSGLPRRTIPI